MVGTTLYHSLNYATISKRRNNCPDKIIWHKFANGETIILGLVLFYKQPRDNIRITESFYLYDMFNRSISELLWVKEQRQLTAVPQALRQAFH
jgi:hypothetical protein